MITVSRKLRHYFQAHVINVMIDHLLKKAMNKLKAAGRLIQWAIELSEFDIKYQPRHAIKAQALTNFIAEFTPGYDELRSGRRQEMDHSYGRLVYTTCGRNRSCVAIPRGR